MATGTLKRLRSSGFDTSYHIPFTNQFRVKCSQCEAAAINGVACHEHSCPNQTHECMGCGNTVQYKGSYCADCR